MKKLITALTACTLCMTAFSTTAFAETTDSWEVIECVDNQMSRLSEYSGAAERRAKLGRQPGAQQSGFHQRQHTVSA